RHDQARARKAKPAPRDRRAAAHDVRSAQYAGPPGLPAARGAFRRQGLPHARAEERAPRRSAKLRRPGGGLGPIFQGRAGLRRARRGNSEGKSMNKPKGLGRGLDALLGADESPRRDSSATLPVSAIRPGKYQPRTRMDEQALAELSASIKAQGLIQPVLVRPINGAVERYELIAGERRWRAAQRAGLAEIPALVREVPDNAALAMSLIENIQREDLNPIEEAAGVQRLVEEFRMTHEQAADAVGR